MSRSRVVICGTLSLLCAGAFGRAAVHIDTSIGSGTPPLTLGGYTLAGFPADVRAPGSWVTDAAAPPPAGNLSFSSAVQLYDVGPGVGEWNGWSHGYSGQVYFSPWTGAGGIDFAQLSLSLPADTLAFYLYLEPELAAATWNFDVSGESVGGSSLATTLLISGGGGAKFIGFYSDDPTDPLAAIHIAQSSEPFLGFGLGEFGIYTYVIPEPATGALLTGLGLLGAVVMRRGRRPSHPTN